VSVVERLDQPAEIALLDLAAEEDVGADIEIVGEREVLVDRLDALPAGVDWTGKCDRFFPGTRSPPPRRGRRRRCT